MEKKQVGGKKIITRCCSCHKIRKRSGEWLDLENFRLNENKTLFSHTVCPACLVDLYPEFASSVHLAFSPEI